MKKTYKVILIVGILSSQSCDSKKGQTNDNNISSIKTPYLGQEPTSLTPKPFAPDLVSTDHLEVLPAILPSLDEFYFTRQIKGDVSKNLGIRLENGSWKTFMEEPNTGEIFISTDNKIMFLGNKYKERTSTGWSEEKSLGPLYKQISIMRLTSSAIGIYVFDEIDSIGTIRMSVIKNGIRQDPIEMGKTFKSGTYISHPFIAPDESYIIWDCEKEDDYGSSDLYISFRKKMDHGEQP
ncbi:hypothetical protein [Christiangramia echinicola]|uniref:hypothetical protein n=1 Tax=Christiangramia echinicola TaxID=279359 RepID=UPI0003FDA026|nr:hypothetical protein [Christiangramia echinicola]